MNTISKNQKHLIFLGFVVFVCLSLMAWLMNRQLKERTTLINNSAAFNIDQHKGGILSREFNTLISGLDVATRITRGFKDKRDFQHNLKTIEAVLIHDPKVSNAWSVVINGKDSSYNASPSQRLKAEPGVNQWINKTFKNAGNMPYTQGLLVKRQDSLHWLVASGTRLSDSSLVITGIDVNLIEFQKYLWGIRDAAKGYAIVLNEQGLCILHPEIKFIGKYLLDPHKSNILERIYKSKESIKERVFSNYLGIPVLRSYSALQIGPMSCIMAIDTPVFIVDEEVDVIRRNAIGMGILTIIIIVGVVAFLQKRWQKEFMLRQQLQVTTEKQEKENALLQLKVLKDKVNPHFLFNSMGSLNALIDKDPKLAREFVVRLSRVYRYLLDSYPNGQATVQNELDFAEQYWFLLNIRFGEAMLPLTVDLKIEHLDKNLPFLSLQIAMENAVKHNIVSKTKPLKISIKSEGDEIVVANNYQLRGHVDDSGKQGISYLLSTYNHFNAAPLRHGVYGGEYRCYFPLL